MLEYFFRYWNFVIANGILERVGIRLLVLVLPFGYQYCSLDFGVLGLECLRRVVLCASCRAAVCWVLGRRERLGGLEGSHPRYLTHFNKEETGKFHSITLEVGKRHCIGH